MPTDCPPVIADTPERGKCFNSVSNLEWPTVCGIQESIDDIGQSITWEQRQLFTSINHTISDVQNGAMNNKAVYGTARHSAVRDVL